MEVVRCEDQDQDRKIAARDLVCIRERGIWMWAAKMKRDKG